MRLRSSYSASQSPSPTVSSNRKSNGHEVTPQPGRPSDANLIPQSGTPRYGASATRRLPFAASNSLGPEYTSSSQKGPGLAAVEKMFGTQLPPADYDTYEKMIADLTRVSFGGIALRASLHAALREFFARHPDAVHVHNKFASSYNKNVGTDDRFHLPVIGLFGVGGTRTGRLSTGYAPQGNQRERELSETAARSPSAGTEIFLAMQYDGAMDFEPVNATQPVRLPERTSPVSPSMNSVDDQDVRPASPHLVDVDMGEPEEEALQRKLLKESALRNVEAEREDRDVEHAAVTPSNPGTADWYQEKEHDSPLPLQEILPPANLAQTPRTPTEAPTQQSDVAEAPPSAALTEGEMMDMNSGEDSLESEEREKSQLPALSQPFGREPKYGSTEEFRLREKRSVHSYLAWLQHRQTRFPTAPPNSSEIILIAEQLNRPEATVYDDILYRWGFETNSKCGAWYKQNRLTVLGKDPRFDEETMGKWDAWVKEGRDDLAKRESR
ncbi:hypothetical protein HBH56_235020 [Parastagonospora nodorum]|uniref:Uncharacterized protein n=2 Tax=Phaeosphaeria nodorum (strain SN15 / ATCC MYA-4574 / FGSC 10173) TaxID=321614 RepID=A0A7U2I4H6_PHANO|nr:hypothetical protein HBH56_235020 [Parastagonospora nodorum]QRC99496.1 hypothetical protein JI435_201610 [Parastagonospora nodorum SN15]KAH3924408.1 hypothetical protein HBH54_193360 [Parastagonospora nodorum]KAH3959452.1 hypothetical protein HBH52_243410 [Parastagonospora nodorum]KAH4097286.1 hypothetical protein HBH46_163330 [Parastagonospora nodorum]